MKKLHKALYWLPRILSIIFIAFLAMFAFDVFGQGYGFWGTLLALFMHLIPNLVLIGFLLIAWKWEQIGGLLFIGIGLFYIIMFRCNADIISYLIIAGPPFLVGLLFLIQPYVIKK